MAGTIMLEALKRLRCPVPLAKVVAYVAGMLTTSREDVREMVFDTLEGGVEFGYVQKDGCSYSIPDIGQFDTLAADGRCGRGCPSPCSRKCDDDDDDDDDDKCDDGCSD